jgi:signal transduction histidine kinase/CHASE3 domain sensor protein
MNVNFSNLKIVTHVFLGGVLILSILITATGLAYWEFTQVGIVSERISNLRTPTVNASSTMKNNVNSALASLRGWMLLKEDRFIKERAQNWVAIRSSQEIMVDLSDEWTNPTNVQRLLKIISLLDEFEHVQNKIESSAWEDENLPATNLLLTKAIPQGDIVFAKITEMINAEKIAPYSSDRKQLLSVMADFRGSFAISLAHIRSFLIFGNPEFGERLASSWEINTNALKLLQQNRHLLNQSQKISFVVLLEAMGIFPPIKDKIFQLRQREDWNRANYHLKVTAAPIGLTLVILLDEMTANQNELLFKDSETNKNHIKDSVEWLIILSMLAIILVIGIIFYTIRKIDIPLNLAIDQAIDLTKHVSASASASASVSATATAPFKYFALPDSSYETNRLLNSLKAMATTVGEVLVSLQSNRALLHASEQRLLLATASAGLGVWDLDLHLDHMECDDKMFELYGITRAASSNKLKAWLSALHPDDKEQAISDYQAALQGLREFDTVFRILCPDGTLKYIKANAVVLRNADGTAERMLGVNANVTTSEKYVRQLEAQRIELEQFTYTVSHDLKSPLITIKGFLGMLVKDAEEGNIERLQSDVNRISAAASKMEDLLDDLLELSRIGRIANEPVDVSLDKLAHEVAETLHGAIAEGGVSLVIEPGLPIVRGDHLRLHEVLQNLIENAIKFMGDQASPSIEIGSSIDEDETVCYVCDNGGGIDPIYADKIFGLFEQMDGSTQGTGIGLALVKRIIEHHGGRVWVESEGPGCGSRFCFSIPIRGES